MENSDSCSPFMSQRPPFVSGNNEEINTWLARAWNTSWKHLAFEWVVLEFYSEPLNPQEDSKISSFGYWKWKDCFNVCQEIIKVREWIPHIGPLTKVIRLKLFLDIIPSSSDDITRAMRGQPKRLSRITWEKWRERHFICFGFVSYRRCFLHSQPPFSAVGHFVCFSACFTVHYFAVYSVLGI